MLSYSGRVKTCAWKQIKSHLEFQTRRGEGRPSHLKTKARRLQGQWGKQHNVDDNTKTAQTFLCHHFCYLVTNVLRSGVASTGSSFMHLPSQKQKKKREKETQCKARAIQQFYRLRP